MIVPIRKQLLFKPFPSNDTTDSGFFIPESCQKPSNKGTVISVGNMVKNVRAGEVVYRTKDWGQIIEENGVTYYIMDEDSIKAID